MITSQEKTPIEVSCGGVVMQRHDIATTHEEADNIIVQQAIQVEIDKKHVPFYKMTHMFLHHCLQQGLQTSVVMESPIKNRVVLDIRVTVEKHQAIIPLLLAHHALLGCDTTTAYFGIGKGKMLKVLKKGITLDTFGNIQADWSDMMEMATKFITACYGGFCMLQLTICNNTIKCDIFMCQFEHFWINYMLLFNLHFQKSKL